VIGDENLKTDYTFDEQNKILWVKTKDDYISLPKKVISAFSAINKTYNFKYIYKTDDDQILVKQDFFTILTNLLTNMNIKSHYGGYIVNIKRPTISDYHRLHKELPVNLQLLVTKYCSGRFYFLSKDAVSCVVNKREKINEEYLEDYAIGYYLDEKYKNNIMALSTQKVFIDIEFSDFPRMVRENKI